MVYTSHDESALASQWGIATTFGTSRHRLSVSEKFRLVWGECSMPPRARGDVALGNECSQKCPVITQLWWSFAKASSDYLEPANIEAAGEKRLFHQKRAQTQVLSLPEFMDVSTSIARVLSVPCAKAYISGCTRETPSWNWAFLMSTLICTRNSWAWVAERIRTSKRLPCVAYIAWYRWGHPTAAHKRTIWY